MNKGIFISTAVGLAALALSGWPARAEPVPERATGIWSVAECGGDGLAMLVSSNDAVLVESWASRNWVALATVEWVAGSHVFTIKGEPGETVTPPINSLARCKVLPGLFPFLFADAVAIFKRWGDIDAHCMGEEGVGARCIATAFDIIDVSGDGTFSRAELSRAVRAAGFFIGHRTVAKEKGYSFVPLDDLLVVQLAASAIGPFIADNLIESYDYDGDGFLAPGELLQDRSPEEGFEGFVAGVATEMAPEAMAALLKTVSSMVGVLDVLR